MEKYTMGQIRKMFAGDDDMITERNDETPVKLRDVPPPIKEYLETELHAKIWENDAMDLPYLYVTIPLTPAVSRGGRRLTTAVLNTTEKKIERNGWHIIEKFEPDIDCPDYTILISPYRHPHEPSIDMFDAEIARQRRDLQDREAMFATDDEDEVVVKEGEDGTGIDFGFVNSSLDDIQKLLSDCKMNLQDVYRDQRYGKDSSDKKGKIVQTMSEVIRVATDISNEMK